ncbi:hypothetical protein [Amycolatopsis xylanica]|uniref:hypothetical protein n=1 Tax=Amycolatopsis xylanica TaxID=589385 RepID=UPI00115FF94A|nr:hypothetical protein [Amycolatopsis xylanica]
MAVTVFPPTTRRSARRVRPDHRAPLDAAEDFEQDAVWRADAVAPEILASFLQLGGNTSKFKYPVRDEFLTAKGNFCAWFKSGSFHHDTTTGETTNFFLRCSAAGS